MKKILFCLIVICFSSLGFAQQTGKQETDRLTKLAEQLAGTYQVQIFDSREKPTIPLSVMDNIKAERKQTEVAYYWLKGNVRIMIPPYSETEKKEFKPLEKVVYLNSSEK